MSSPWTTIARASARYALSGVQSIPRSKGTAARADGLVIKFERANTVEDIMTEARGPRIGLTFGLHLPLTPMTLVTLQTKILYEATATMLTLY